MKKHLPFILASTTIFLGVGVLVAHAQGYTPLAPLPGTFTEAGNVKTTNITTYLSGAIKLLIAVGAALAVLFAVIGGTQYVAAGISPDAKSDAKSKITNAFIGLTLILTSYLILNSINPALVQFKEGFLPKVNPPLTDMTVVETLSYSGQLGESSCPPGDIPCGACSSCSAIPASVPTKKDGLGACYNSQQCFINTSLLGRIQAISIPNWRVTEAWPPTVKHLSACHRDGTCADLNNTNNLTDPINIKVFYDAFRAAGLNVLYESDNCAPYIAAGIANCATYDTMTNRSSFHVK